MVLYSIFPIAVIKFELGREFSAEEMSFVYSQEKHNNQGNTTSNDRYVLRNEVMSEISSFVEVSIAEYLKAIYDPKKDVKLRITQSWLNYCQPGQYHHKHAHPNSFISGVLYPKASKERDRIYFFRDGYKQINLPTENFNLFNSESWWFEVKTGDLLIFPSSLTHMVDTVKEEERISLSFNTFPIGYVGEEETLTALHV